MMGGMGQLGQRLLTTSEKVKTKDVVLQCACSFAKSTIIRGLLAFYSLLKNTCISASFHVEVKFESTKPLYHCSVCINLGLLAVMYACVMSFGFFSVSEIFLLYFRIVLMVCYF